MSLIVVSTILKAWSDLMAGAEAIFAAPVA
jgi:hypothetical protein